MKTEKIYKCFFCPRHAAELHEIFFGHGMRQISITYCLQIPACRQCHDKEQAHKDPEKNCQLLGIDYEKIAPIMHKSCKRWNISERKYMRGVRDYMVNKFYWYNDETGYLKGC